MTRAVRHPPTRLRRARTWVRRRLKTPEGRALSVGLLLILASAAITFLVLVSFAGVLRALRP